MKLRQSERAMPANVTTQPGDLNARAINRILTPPPLAPGRDEMTAASRSLEALLKIDRNLADRPDAVFGLEARAAYHLSQRGEDPLEPAVRSLLLRPAPEPILHSYRDRFLTWSIDDDSMVSLASCLIGRPTAYRTTPCATHVDPEGYRQIFPPAEVSAKWLDRQPSPPTKGDIPDALVAALTALATTVLHHPLPDGNGRVGRALFHGALVRVLGLNSPLIPLGPFTYARGRAVMAAWVALGVDGDWSPLIRTYEAVLADVVDLHLQLVEIKPPPDPAQ